MKNLNLLKIYNFVYRIILLKNKDILGRLNTVEWFDNYVDLGGVALKCSSCATSGSRVGIIMG